MICELTFFVKYLSNEKSVSQRKSLLSKTCIGDYLSDYLFEILDDDHSLLLVEELCSALQSIGQIPSKINEWRLKLFNYLRKNKSNSLKIIDYFIFIQTHSIDDVSIEHLSLLNDYLIEIGIHQTDLNILCQLLTLISSFHYSHQLFHQNILNQIKKYNYGKDQDFSLAKK